MERGVFGEQPFYVIDGPANAHWIAAVDVPGNKMQGRFAGLTERQKRGQDGRAGIREGRTSDECLGIGAQNSRHGVLIVARVVFRSEEIRTAAVFADIGFIRDLPIADAGAALFVVAHHFIDELFPLFIAGGIDDFVIDRGVPTTRIGRSSSCLSASSTIGRPVFTSPGVPAERVKALRDAFDAMVKDPVFLAEAAKEHFDINPVSGAEMQKIVTEIVATPRPIADRLLQIIGGVGENRGG